jgi:hypothetical protein
MNVEKMKQVALLATELSAEGIYGFNFDSKRFHVSRKNIKEFEDLEIKVRGDLNSEYPYEVSHKGDGFTVFCLVSKEEMKDFPQFKEFCKSELLKRIAELEGELEGGQLDEQSTDAV